MKSLLLCAATAFTFSLIVSARAQNLTSPTEYLTSPTPSPKRTPAPSRKATPAGKPAPVSKATPVPKSTPKPTPAAAAATPRPAATPALVKHENVNDMARFIAGLPPERDAELLALAKTAEWTAYAALMDKAWPHFDYIKLSQVRVWTAKALGKTRINTVFYPFSGPDFIYAANYFPQASTYILCGLEPVGDVPSVQKLQPLLNSLGWLQASFKTLLNAGYFVTSDMSTDLKMSPLQGTLPILYVMLARSGDRITSISTGPNMAEIEFIPAKGGRARSLYYFSSDLSNGGIGKGGALYNFLEKMHPDTAYVKSASYLMHEDEFSAIRNILLSKYHTIVQDDSGIPLRFFDQHRWKLKLYGTYAAPLDIFAKYYQQDLADLYKKTPGITPLSFSVGYHWSYKEAGLMVATAMSPLDKAASSIRTVLHPRQ